MRFQLGTVVVLAAMGGGSLCAAEKTVVDVYVDGRDGSSQLLGTCSEPVTLGGGMTRENTRPPEFPEARKMPESIHHCAQCGSSRGRVLYERFITRNSFA